MELTRRQFFQRLGWAIAAIGISQGSFLATADRYNRALAAPNRRKLALLVGINQYSEAVSDIAASRGGVLLGSLSDVALQQELLIHRFGFAKDDILTLLNDQSTRVGVETAFQQHLIDQAQPDDSVVFHFSGLGSRVRLGADQVEVSTLVPFDGVMPSDDAPTIRDLPEETLLLLGRSLPSSNFTAIIDAGVADMGAPLVGNFRVRSRPHVPSGQLHAEEQALQEQLSNALAETRRKRNDALPGAWLRAASSDGSGRGLALEGQWNGFAAGLFTYALTQYLWQVTEPQTVQVAFNATSGMIERVTTRAQQPSLDLESARDRPLYSPIPNQAAADGVITQIAGDGRVQVWLGGLPAHALTSYSAGAQLAIAGSTQRLQVRSRDGLRLIASLPADLATSVKDLIGQPVQELVRLVPKSVGLTVALDSHLERIERVDATSAFSSVKVATVSAGEQSADFLFGKLKPRAQTLAASLSDSTLEPLAVPAKGVNATKQGFGLFYPAQLAVPGTIASDEEAVKTAVNRLTPVLRSLQAVKLLSLTENATASGMRLRVALEAAKTPTKPIAQQETLRSLDPGRSEGSTANRLIALPAGESVQFRLHNLGDRSVYAVLLHLVRSGTMLTVQLPTQPEDGATDGTLKPLLNGAIAPNQPLVLASPVSSPQLSRSFVCVSYSPFEQVRAIAQRREQASKDERPSDLELAQAVLQDLQSNLNVSSDVVPLNMYQWATFSFCYQTLVATV
ncbi:MAG: caspase family protein [Kaiparowitsia implicata GSE-PSE-MK54-09C]|jgi:hypothetical protein|nr:caspase family protein [Kaiparowitsia implicata GSE-PSE-MK54-09C]